MNCLPFEVLQKVFTYLGFEDLLNARMVNKRFYSATCCPPICRRFQVVFEYDRLKPGMYELQVRKIKVNHLHTTVIMDHLKEYNNIESFKIYNGLLTVECIIRICQNYWSNLKTFECHATDLYACSGCACVTRNSFLEIPSLRRIKMVECTAVDLRSVIYLFQLGTRLEEFIFVVNTDNINILPTLADYLQTVVNTLKYLKLTYRDENGYILRILNLNFKKLIKLKLELDFFTLTFGDLWEVIERYPLESLKLCGIMPARETLIKEFDIGIPNNLQTLKHFILDKFLLGNAGFELIVSFTRLEHLSLTNSILKNLQLPSVQNLNLKVLRLEMSDFIQIGQNIIPQMHPTWPNVKYLDLSSTNINDEDIQNIFKYWTQLEALKIDGCNNLTESAMMGRLPDAVPISNLKNLHYLGMGMTKFTDRLCEFVVFPELRVLHLFPNITSEGLHLLGRNCPLLEVVCPDNYHYIDMVDDIKDYFPRSLSSRFTCKCKHYFQLFRKSL